jgi:hypothetical protein
MNAELSMVLPINAEPWKVIYPIRQNQKGSVQGCGILNGSAY